MERPFDYPGMGEPTGFDPHQLRRKEGNGISHSYDAMGGANDHVMLWFAPNWWTDDEVHRAVRQIMPTEYCSHEHDCCGRYYSMGGRVAAIWDGVRDDHGDKARAVLVVCHYIQNV